MNSQLVNKRTEILAVATSNKTHLCNYYNDVFAMLISMPRFKCINFYENSPKIMLFFPKKYKKFERLAPPPDLQLSVAGGFVPDSQNSPDIAHL